MTSAPCRIATTFRNRVPLRVPLQMSKLQDRHNLTRALATLQRPKSRGLTTMIHRRWRVRIITTIAGHIITAMTRGRGRGVVIGVVVVVRVVIVVVVVVVVMFVMIVIGVAVVVEQLFAVTVTAVAGSGNWKQQQDRDREKQNEAFVHQKVVQKY